MAPKMQNYPAHKELPKTLTQVQKHECLTFSRAKVMQHQFWDSILIPSKLIYTELQKKPDNN